MIPRVTVLRLGHRHERDKRLSTHVGLVSALFGAERLIYSGDHDQSLEESIESVAKRWGEPTRIEYTTKPYQIIREFQGISVHLTMYGAPHDEVIKQLKMDFSKEPVDSLLIVVGGPKVPRHVYSEVDYNCAVGYFPHSEVSALGIFLYDFLGKDQLYQQRTGTQIGLHGGEKGWGKRQKERTKEAKGT